MKAITCAVIALACVLGLVVADGYYGFGGHSGGYGGASYVPLYAGYGGARSGGFGQGGCKLFLVHSHSRERQTPLTF